MFSYDWWVGGGREGEREREREGEGGREREREREREGEGEGGRGRGREVGKGRDGGRGGGRGRGRDGRREGEGGGGRGREREGERGKKMEGGRKREKKREGGEREKERERVREGGREGGRDKITSLQRQLKDHTLCKQKMMNRSRRVDTCAGVATNLFPFSVPIFVSISSLCSTHLSLHTHPVLYTHYRSPAGHVYCTVRVCFQICVFSNLCVLVLSLLP